MQTKVTVINALTGVVYKTFLLSVDEDDVNVGDLKRMMQHHASETSKIGATLTPQKMMMFVKENRATLQAHQLEDDERLGGLKDTNNELVIQLFRKVGCDVVRIKWLEDIRNGYIH